MARPVLLLPPLLLLLLVTCCCRAEVSSGSDDLQLVRYVIRRRLPPRSCLLGKILLLDDRHPRLRHVSADDVDIIEFGYERNAGERTKATPCQLLSSAHIRQHGWLSGWLAELFPGRLVRRVYPQPVTGRSWPKTRRELERAIRLHTASGAADAYAVLFLSSPEDLRS